MELTQKQKMLAVALFTRRIRRENTAAILMVLKTDDEIDDLTWYMGQHRPWVHRETLWPDHGKWPPRRPTSASSPAAVTLP